MSSIVGTSGCMYVLRDFVVTIARLTIPLFLARHDDLVIDLLTCLYPFSGSHLIVIKHSDKTIYGATIKERAIKNLLFPYIIEFYCHYFILSRGHAFAFNEHVNCQNTRYWSDEEPDWMQDGALYLDFLQNMLIPFSDLRISNNLYCRI